MTPTSAAALRCSSWRMPLRALASMPGIALPADPSVTMQYVTEIPWSVQVAIEPATPKSTSSGCAVTTSIFAGSDDPFTAQRASG